MNVAVTGATGFVGRALCAVLRADGHDVITIGRGPVNDRQWDPLAGAIPSGTRDAIRRADAIAHLAGATIGVRWTEARKREILDSRVIGTRLLAEIVSEGPRRPRTLVCSSAMGFYGSRGDDWLDESSGPGHDFAAGVAVAWERAADAARAAGVRVVHLRQGLVLGDGGGVLARMLTPFRLGVGGRLGAGTQWMSWITLDDLVRVFTTALGDASTLAGGVNAVSPSPVRNSEFTAALARALHRPAVLPVPAFALRMLFGEMADGALLSSQRMRPALLEASGFRWEDPAIDGALRRVLRA